MVEILVLMNKILMAGLLLWFKHLMEKYLKIDLIITNIKWINMDKL